MMRHCTAGILAIAALASSAGAQEPPKPGPEHARLKELAGTWDCTGKLAGQIEFKGVSTSKMELGGFWLITEFEAELFGQPFRGRSLDGYDPIKKKYVSIWTDSMSPTPMILEGDIDKDGKVVTLTGEGGGPHGVMKYRTVTEFKDKDTFVWTMYAPVGENGKEAAMMTATYKRKK